MRPIPLGEFGSLTWEVTPKYTVHLGETEPAGGLVVFSTPSMILLMERTARAILAPYLEPGEVSVGVKVEIEHLAGAPLGAQVRGEARLVGIDRRMFDFEVAVFDAHEPLGRGRHRRAVAPVDRLRSKLSPKTQPGAGVLLPMQAEPQRGPLPQFTTLAVEIAGPRAEIALNRPARRNAIDLRMTAELEQLTAWLAGHPEVRVAVLTGRGEAFCAGDDVREVAALAHEQAAELSFRQARLFLSWERLPQVLIAAVNGPAHGAGCVAACACDFRLAAGSAQFGMPEIRLGWPPGYGIAQLTALVGKARALEMCLTGRKVSAEEAREWGLAHRVAAPPLLLESARALAGELLAQPAAALRETKRLVHQDEGVQPKAAHLADTAAYLRCLSTPDAREGIAAFLEKRPARFEGE